MIFPVDFAFVLPLPEAELLSKQVSHRERLSGVMHSSGSRYNTDDQSVQGLLAQAVANCAGVERGAVSITQIRDVTRETSYANARVSQ